MYVPKSFAMGEESDLYDFIDCYGFATLVSQGDPLMASHIPLEIDRDGARLLGHMAKANPHWQRFNGRDAALAVFRGADAYISPAWFTTHLTVPTWNYEAVHAHGTPRVLEDLATKRGVVERLVEKYEGPRTNRWRIPQDTEYAAYLERLLGAIVAFEIPIDELNGKSKMSQNRAANDRQRVAEALEGAINWSDQAVGARMRELMDV